MHTRLARSRPTDLHGAARWEVHRNVEVAVIWADLDLLHGPERAPVAGPELDRRVVAAVGVEGRTGAAPHPERCPAGTAGLRQVYGHPPGLQRRLRRSVGELQAGHEVRMGL